MSKWIIVSNRLPFGVDSETGKVVRSSGGLVSAISGIKNDQPKVWVGIAPKGLEDEDITKASDDPSISYRAVNVSQSTYDLYYNGFSNDVIWPLFHYETDFVKFNWEGWEAYKKVNQAFAKAILDVAEPGDLIWIHDFHLFLLPKMLRSKKKNLKIGFFLHIPFPSSEIFRQLPVRREILEAILAADLIGFHDYSYLRHFCVALLSILGLESSLLRVQLEGRVVNLGVFPVSIDTKRFVNRAKSKAVEKLKESYRQGSSYENLILGVDRLDYTKGIDLKLMAFREMLRLYPEVGKKTSLIQIAVPSRTGVPEYARLKREIDTLVGEINGEFGRPNHIPVQYIFSSVDFNELVALYRLAKVLLVTSKRDGMNLVSLEYLASQDPADPGVAMLSEFAGAISTLSHVMPLNPWDVVGTAKRIAHSLELKKDERVEKHELMIKYLESYTATDWAQNFMGALERQERTPTVAQEEIRNVGANLQIPPPIKDVVRNRSILIFVDYDGTLVPIEDSPEKALMDSRTKGSLLQLIRRKELSLVVVSGRGSKFLSEQFSGVPISMAAEHGAKFYNSERKRWQSLVNSDTQSWYPTALKIMKDYASHVPGSFVEKKEYGLSWHYRKAPKGFGGYQSRKLKEELELGLSNYPVTVLSGKKVIEARAIEANKGAFVRWFHSNRLPFKEKDPLIVAIGDDMTDEDIFASVPPDAITIKVGEGDTQARYRLESQGSLMSFLSRLSDLAQG